jgi:hypothetical protein
MIQLGLFGSQAMVQRVPDLSAHPTFPWEPKFRVSTEFIGGPCCSLALLREPFFSLGTSKWTRVANKVNKSAKRYPVFVWRMSTALNNFISLKSDWRNIWRINQQLNLTRTPAPYIHILVPAIVCRKLHFRISIPDLPRHPDIRFWSMGLWSGEHGVFRVETPELEFGTLNVRNSDLDILNSGFLQWISRSPFSFKWIPGTRKMDPREVGSRWIT